MPTLQGGGVLNPSQDLGINGQVLSFGGATVAGLGYGLGTGARVTQITSRATAVSVNALCGTITTDTTSLAAEASAAFTVNNAAVQIGDVVVLSIRSGLTANMTTATVTTVANGSFAITVANNNAAAGAAETGAIVINFLVLKGQTA